MEALHAFLRRCPQGGLDSLVPQDISESIPLPQAFRCRPHSQSQSKLLSRDPNEMVCDAYNP